MVKSMNFPATLDSLPQMLTFIREGALFHNVDDEKIGKVELAAEEVIVNIISYAFKQKKGEISIGCYNNGGRFEVEISDEGIPFNPIDVEVEVEKEKPLFERKVGGLGIFLVRKMMDEISYQRMENKNILRMSIEKK